MKKIDWRRVFFQKDFRYHLLRHFIFYIFEKEFGVDLSLFRRFICPYCGQKFNNIYAFKAHLVRCGGFQADYDLAYRIYVEAKYYVRKTNRNRDGEVKYRCQLCYKKFDTRYEAMIHVYNMHLRTKITSSIINRTYTPITGVVVE